MVLRLPEVRALLGARLTNALATTALATVVGYHVYQLTRDALALGWLGLVEAVPALSLALLGGHVADRVDRRRIVLWGEGALALCALILSGIAADPSRFGLGAILIVIFASGVAAGFARPALTAFDAQVIPREHAAKGQSWASGTWQAGAIAGPALGGVGCAAFGVAATYLMIGGLLAVSALCIARISRKPMPAPIPGESLRRSLSQGLRFVFGNQILVGAMALDLFAVLFGGAIAILPVFASDILHVGPIGLGLLRTAPAAGALAVMLLATRRPPTRRAGHALLWCVAGFGVSMIVFSLSRSFVLSLVALFASGVTDGVSVIIRHLIVRVMSPEAMRGRVASINWVFIGASNELGAFESGVAARLLGAAPSVLAGGCVTLLVVAIVAIAAPRLRRLDLDQHLA